MVAVTHEGWSGYRNSYVSHVSFSKFVLDVTWRIEIYSPHFFLFVVVTSFRKEGVIMERPGKYRNRQRADFILILQLALGLALHRLVWILIRYFILDLCMTQFLSISK